MGRMVRSQESPFFPSPFFSHLSGYPCKTEKMATSDGLFFLSQIFSCQLLIMRFDFLHGDHTAHAAHLFHNKGKIERIDAHAPRSHRPTFAFPSF